MKIIPLSEGIFWASKTKEFTRTDTNPIAEPGALKMAICPFLIQLPDDLILVDAGLGFERNGKPILLSLLQDAGYEPKQITKVLLSHLHKDHTDGLGFFTNDHFETYFPKATLFLQRREMDYALSQPDNPSFNLQTLKALLQLPNVTYMEADKGSIGAHITFEVTGGHSPFHQVFWFGDQDEIAFYGGDNLPQESYLKYHIAYKTDYEGRMAMALRQQWEQQAREENWMILLYHDLEKPILKL